MVISGFPSSVGCDAVDSPLQVAGRHVNLLLFTSLFLRPVIAVVDLLFIPFFFIDPVGLSVIIPHVANVHWHIVLLPAFSGPVACLATDLAYIGIYHPIGLVVLSGPVASGLTFSFPIISFAFAFAFSLHLCPSTFALGLSFATLPVGVALLPISFPLASLASLPLSFSLASLPVALASLPVALSLAFVPVSFLSLSLLSFALLPVSFAFLSPAQCIDPISLLAFINLGWGVVVVDQFTDLLKVSEVWTQSQVRCQWSSDLVGDVGSHDVLIQWFS